MSTEEAFVRAISDAPEDELNWLVYADWLEEQGDLFGEMLRLRIQLDKLSATDPTRPALAQRHAILESATGFAAWRDQLARHGFGVERRGVLAELLLDLSRWALLGGDGRDVLGDPRMRPFFESLRSVLSVPRRFMALPTRLVVWANKDEGSEIEFWLTRGVATELLDLPCLQNLNSLKIFGSRTVCLYPETVRAIATHASLGRLRSLDLSSHRLGAAGAQAIASSDRLTNLTTLALCAASLDYEAARALAGSRHLANVTDLDLRYNSLGDAGAAALAAASWRLVNLKKLKLAHNSIGPESAAALKRRFGDVCLLPQLHGAEQPRPGGWDCLECSARNFAKREACYECRCARPGTLLRSGDWLCPGCDAHNFAKRDACHQCRAARPA